MRDRLLMDIWEPNVAILDYPKGSVGYEFLKLYDEAFDLLCRDGQSSTEAVSSVRIMFGSSLPGRKKGDDL